MLVHRVLMCLEAEMHYESMYLTDIPKSILRENEKRQIALRPMQRVIFETIFRKSHFLRYLLYPVSNNVQQTQTPSVTEGSLDAAKCLPKIAERSVKEQKRDDDQLDCNLQIQPF